MDTILADDAHELPSRYENAAAVPRHPLSMSEAHFDGAGVGGMRRIIVYNYINLIDACARTLHGRAARARALHA